jgi:hypothetical protein
MLIGHFPDCFGVLHKLQQMSDNVNAAKNRTCVATAPLRALDCQLKTPPLAFADVVSAYGDRFNSTSEIKMHDQRS